MADWIIISAVVFTYLVVVLIIGVAGRQKDASVSLDAYVAGSRGLGFGLLFFIIGAEFYSSVTFLGAPGWAYSRGVPALFMMVSFSFALLPWWWIGVYTARLGRHYGFLTQSDLLGARYRSPCLSVLAAAIGVIALLPYFVVQIVGSGYLFTAATGGKIPFWLCTFLVFIIVLIYTFVGGLRAIGWTNVIQGFILLIAAWTIGLVIPYRFYGGVEAMFMRLATEAPDYLTIPGHHDVMPWAAYTSSIIVIILGMTMWPHLFNRAYSAANDDSLRRTIVLFPLYSLLIVPVLFVGFAGVLMIEDMEKPDQVMIALIDMAGIFALVCWCGYFRRVSSIDVYRRKRVAHNRINPGKGFLAEVENHATRRQKTGAADPLGNSCYFWSELLFGITPATIHSVVGVGRLRSFSTTVSRSGSSVFLAKSQ